ncbi:MAG: hypothetical protein IPP41_13550 [Rhodocyclaceae bacterium]|nr:hypothetical protein [Rhodocyclaceae bacterium]
MQLADAFKRFAAAGATDLVIDLRYNGGGFLIFRRSSAIWGWRNTKCWQDLET